MRARNAVTTIPLRRTLSLISLCAVAWIVTAANVAFAQIANCPFAPPGTSPPQFTVDGMLLVSYAMGLRGVAMLNKIFAISSFIGAEANIAPNLSRFDLDGDGFFGANDAMIILRYLSGYSPAVWIPEPTFASNAQQKTATAIESFMNVGCPAPAPSAPFVAKDTARLLQHAT